MTSATREQKKLLYEQLIGQKLAGKFTITGLLGFGGMGAVYEAIQSPMDRKVALKIIPSYDPTAAARFEREAYTVSKLSHPNTVTVFDFGHTEDGQLYLSMEYLEGRTLTDLIRKEGPLHPARAIHIAEQVCRSLGEAHRTGIMHRDVKPDNILLIRVDQDPDYVKVLDFGIAKAIQGEDDVNLTAEGRIVGTPRYMSPEQILALHVDHRSDIYSLGCILFEMLCGTPPFEQQSTAALMMSHAQQMPPHFSERLREEHLHVMPPDLELIVHRTMAKSAEARHRDTEELRQELQMALTQLNTPHGARTSQPFRHTQPPMTHSPTSSATRLERPSALHNANPTPFEHHTGDFSHQTGNFASQMHATRQRAPHTGSAEEEARFERDLQHVNKGPTPLYVGIGLLLVTMIGLGSYLIMQDDGAQQDPFTTGSSSSSNTSQQPSPVTSPAQAQEASDTAQAQQEEEEVALETAQIITEPAGAKLLYKGKEVGTTPHTVTLSELDAPTSYRVELDGYRADIIYIDPKAPKAVYASALEKQPATTNAKSTKKNSPRTTRSRAPVKDKVEAPPEPKETAKVEEPATVKPKVLKLDDTQDTRSPDVKKLD